MLVAVSSFDIKTAICIFTDECWRPWYTYAVPHYYLFPPGDVRCVVVTTSLSSKERFEVLPSIYLDKGVSSLRDGGAHWDHARLFSPKGADPWNRANLKTVSVSHSMLGAIKGTSPLCRSVQDREDLRSLEHVVLGHFAHRGCRCRLCEVGYDVGCWSLVGYIMNLQICENSITTHGVFSPAVWLRLSWMVVSSELANSPCSRLQTQKSSAPLRDHCCGQVTWQVVLPLLWSSHLAGTGHKGSGSGEGVPLGLLPALYLSDCCPITGAE